MKKFLLLVILLTLVSCKTIIQREVEFVFPVVPELEILHVPELDDVFTEEIIVNSEDIYELTKQNRPYNIYVEDVQRTSVIPTASQTARNVPLTKTDYIITKIKDDGDEDWSSVTTSGVVYAWYNSGESIPYKMSGSS